MVNTLIFEILVSEVNHNTMHHVQEYLLFGFCVLLFSAYVSVEYFSVRRLVLDPDTNHYSVYKGAMLIATEHCHNIYIRMLEKSPSNRLMRVYLQAKT